MAIEPLTKRETEVVALLAEGLSNREVAERLFIATSTVKSYINELNSKLNTHNRKEIVVQARKLGLLQHDRPNHNLPATVTAFVGRKIELEAIYKLLTKPGVRLLTILAPGGMGKTRLALESAKAQFSNFKDIYLLQIQHMRDAEHIFSTLAEQMGYQFQDGLRNPKQQVLDYLSGRQLLLILDSAEYMLDHAMLIMDVLQTGSDIKVLVTSREKLNLHSETVYFLSGMQVPSQALPDELLTFDAVQLFVGEVKRLYPDFEIAEENLEKIVQICRLVGGMPLAILLAASWTDVLSLESIHEAIQHNIDFLETTMRDLPPRHRSIRAVCEAAWERLTAAEQQVFAKMSVFWGGCTFEAAESVIGASPHSLQSLFNKALLIRTADGRYEIHDLLRQFGEEQLDRMNQSEAAYDAHSRYYVEYLCELEANIKGRRQIAGIKDIDADFENIRRAWDWLLVRKDYQSIGRVLDCLLWYFIFRSRLYDGYNFFIGAEEVLSSVQNDAARLVEALACAYRIRVYSLASTQKQLNDNYETLFKELDRSLELAKGFDDLRAIAACLIIQNTVIFRAKLWQSSAIQFVKVGQEKALEYCQTLGDEFSMSYIFHHLGLIYGTLGDRDKSIRFGLESEKLCRQIGNKLGLAFTLFWSHGRYALHGGKFDEAEQHFNEIYEIQREMAYKTVFLSVSLSYLGLIACFQGNFEQAGNYCADAMSIALDLNNTESKTWAFSLRGLISLVEEDYVQSYQYLDMALQNLWGSNEIMQIGLAILYYARSDYQEGQKWLAKELDRVCRSPSQEFLYALLCIVTRSLSLAHNDDNNKAVEYLALAFTHPFGPKAFLQKCPLFMKLRDDLKRKLGEDAYHEAWECGKMLDVETVILEMKKEFSEEK